MESEFEKQLTKLINEHSMENSSNTPDFILARYLKGCLDNFNVIIQARESWYGRGRFETNTILLDYDGTGNPPPQNPTTNTEGTGEPIDIIKNSD